MSETIVWAYKPLKELNGETGFVACSEELASDLIASGEAQDPKIGASMLKHVEEDSGYATKEMTPRRGRPPKSASSTESHDAPAGK
jgi:hypothetical protein